MNFAYLTTFYSYKGGVGRTLALANVGAALAKRGSGRVLLIDCDLEAPGLHRIEALRPSNQAAEGGVLPWLAQLDPHSAEPADDSRFWDAIYQPRSDLALYVLPACHGDDVADWYARIDWRAWFTSDPDTMISPLLQAFRRVLVEVQQRGYAYVLVDSRTGHSDLGGLMLFQLPHMAVIVSNYNDQNLGGLRPILQAMLPYTDRDRPPANGIMRGFFPPPAGHGADAHQLGVLERWLVFSPVPADRDLDELLDQRRARAKALLAADVALGGYSEIPAVLQFQLQETLAVLDAPESKLAERYLEIAQQIEANRAQRLRELGADLTAVTSPRRVDLSGRGETRVSAQGAIEKSTTAQGRTFEQRVAELLRLLGYEVSGETMGDGNRIDLIAKSRSGLRAEHFVIECKDQKAAISKDQVEKLWIWRDRERRSVPGADGMFITSGDYAPAARASAEVHGLLLSTLKELERKLFDPEPYVQTWLQSYEGKREAQAYVAQQLYAGDGAPEKSSAGASADADAAEGPDETEADESERADTRIDLIPYALDWLGGRTSAQRLPNRFWVLIGNYGTGKSTFTRRLTFELLRRRRAGEAWPLPILINLKERAGAPSLDNLLQEFLSEYRLNASVRQLRYGLEQGTAALLLDSFDEMALAQYGRTLEQQLREFARLVLEFPDAKVLLTSRTHLFRSEQELERSVLGRDGLAEAGSPLAATARELGASIQTLAPFTPAQIATFIRNQASPERAEAILEFIEQTHKLSDLAPTAVLLEMIISGYDALRTRARAGGVIAAELYQVFVDEWLGKRAHANAQLSQAQMTQWLQVLARQLWDAPGQRLHYRHLSDLIMARRELSAAIDPTRVDLELRTASFLTRNSAGDYGFSHRSFLEFFLARALVQCLMDTREAGLEAAAEQLVAALPDARLSPECLRFFQDLAQLACADVTPFWLHASRVVRQLLSKVRAPARSANALRMARECAADPQEWIPEGAELAGADLSDEAWPLPLRKANLRGARLQRCRFSAGGNGPRVADLTAAILVEAEVDHANFGGARLRSADATGIRGEWTTWIGAHCQQARFAGAYLREADFRAAALDGADFSAAMLGNALFRGARPKGCAWTGADCQQARFAGAYLCGADFRAAALDGADFSAAMLGNARFRGARLKGCAWTGADLCAVQYSERPQQKAPRATAPRAELRWAASSNPTALLAATPPFLLVARNAVIEVWDCAVGTRTAVLEGHQHWITAVAALPDGRLASGAGDHSIRLWDAQGNCTAVLEGHQGSVLALAALPDGRLASGADDHSIRLWDAQGNCTAVLEGHRESVLALAALPDGRLASGAGNHSIRLWDAQGNCTAVLEGHQGSVRALAALPDGRLASCADDRSIRLWDAQGNCTAVLEGHRGSVRALAALPDGRLASGAGDGSIRLWDAQGNCTAVLEGHRGSVLALAALPDGRLASGADDHSIRLWDAQGNCSNAVLEGHQSWGRALAALPDGRLASGADDRSIRLWDAQGNCTAVLEGHQGWVLALAALPDGRLASGADDGSIRLWDAQGNCTAVLEGHRESVLALAALPGGRLASGAGDHSIRLWDAQGNCTAVLEGHRSWVRALAALPDGRLASCADDRSIRLWDAQGNCTAVLEGHQHWITAVAALPDGRLASGAGDHSIRLWDAQGNCTAVLEGHQGWVLALAALPDGRLASGAGDGSIRVWDALGNCTAVLKGHQDWVRALAVLPNGRLASGADDGSIRLWDVRGKPVRTHVALAGAKVLALTVLGDVLVAGLGTGEILYFDIRPAALAHSSSLRRVLAARFQGEEQMLLYPDGAFWWPDRHDGLLPELADETWYRLVGSELFDPDAAFPASAIPEQRLPRPRTIEEILGPLPGSDAGKRRRVRKA